MMLAESFYIVQSQIIGLSELPFSIDKKSIRKPFQTIFSSKDCFSNMQSLILNAWPTSTLPSQPFIRGLGQICFNTRSARLLNSHERIYDLPKYLKKSDDCSEEKITFWGYNQSLEDQRMNQLYFELRRPLFLKATHEQKVKADGRLFLHIYPAGYLMIHLAIAMKQALSLDDQTIREILLETRPGSKNQKWFWRTKLIDGTLSEVTDLARSNIFQSIFSSPPVTKSSRWQSAIKIVSTIEAKKLSKLILKGDYEVFKIRNSEYIISSRHGIICNFEPTRERRSALRFFWKIFTFHNLVAFKNYVYDAYAEFLREEILQLRKHRLSYIIKLKEDLFRLSVFDPLISEYLYALDGHIRSAPPFYRAIYSSISNGGSFDMRRNKIKSLVSEWESEVAQWDPSMIIIWKKVASPLLSLLKLI